MQGEAVARDDWYGLGTAHWKEDGQLFVGHDGDIGTYHGSLVMATADNVAVAVLVPAPARTVIDSEVTTGEVPQLLRDALEEG